VPGPQGSFNASYLHTTTVDHINLSETWLSQGYLNSQLLDQAIVLATPKLGTLNNSAFDFDYSSDGSWRLFNYAGAFPAGSELNILVDQRSFEMCVLKSQDQIFSDRFQ
jgi:hypothetical protein